MSLSQLIELVPLVLIAFAVFAFIYTGICGLTGRPIYLPGRGGGGGRTVSGGAARIVGALFLLIGLFVAVVVTRSVVLSSRGT